MKNNRDLKLTVLLCISATCFFLSPMYLRAQLPYTPPEGGQIQSMPDPWFRYPIEVFAGQTSVSQGGSINFYVATGDSANLNNAKYKIQIIRIGAMAHNSCKYAILRV